MLEKNKLKWACRRGMLELDLVLTRFLESSFEKLNDAQKKEFEKLLLCTDPELENWLLKQQPVSKDHKDLFGIIELIKIAFNNV